MVVYACPRCASQNMHAPTIADGGILGYSTTAQQVCDDCDFQGAALEFDEVEDHQAFKRAVEAGEHPLESPEGEPDAADGQTTPDRGLERLQQTRAPAQTQRGTAVFIALGGAAVFVTILAFAGVMLVRPDSPALFLAGVVLVILGFVEALAFWLIARRLWNGPAQASDDALDDPGEA